MKLDTHRKPIEKRIQIFERRFGKKHLVFAYHAAFPLTLTPDLLQCLWANFRCDMRGEVLDIPWVAVNDFLLSGLCEEVGEELYEMDAEIRDFLLEQLQGEENFQHKRIQELSSFLLAYAEPLLDNSDRDLRDFAQAQRWTALAYSQPEKAARELALELSKTYQNESDRDDIIRISEIVETLKNPLAEFEQLLNYARGMVDLVRGNAETALNYFEKLGTNENIVSISGVNCLIPQYAGVEEVQENIEKPLISLRSLHFLIFLFFALFGGLGLFLYNIFFPIQATVSTKTQKALPRSSSLPIDEVAKSSLPVFKQNGKSQKISIPESPKPNVNETPSNSNKTEPPESPPQDTESTNTDSDREQSNSIIVAEVPVQTTDKTTPNPSPSPDRNSNKVESYPNLGKAGDCRTVKREVQLYAENNIRALTGIFLNENDVVQLLENNRVGKRLIAVFDPQRQIRGYIETSELKLCPTFPIAKAPNTVPFNSMQNTRFNCQVIRELSLYDSPGFDSQKREFLEIGMNVEVDPQRNATANNFQWIYVSTIFGDSGWVIADSVGCRVLPLPDL